MLYVHSVGHFHPENVIDNKFLTDLDIGTNDDWIMERVGIAARRTVLPLGYILETKNSDPREADQVSIYTNAQTGAMAARHALARTDLSLSDIGMVIAGGCSPQHTAPAEAATIACELGIDVPVLDINSSCTSVAAQLHFLRGMDPHFLPDYILIVHPENNTRHIDYSDRSGAVLWGDCSTAAILSKKIPSKMRVQHTSLHSAPTSCYKVKIPTGGHFSQEGRTVQTFAIKRSLKLVAEAKKLILTEELDRLHLIGHQANLMMLNSVVSKVDMAAENHHYNVDRFGNCGAAGALSVLSERWESWHHGDRIIMPLVGAGLTWGNVLFHYCDEENI